MTWLFVLYLLFLAGAFTGCATKLALLRARSRRPETPAGPPAWHPEA